MKIRINDRPDIQEIEVIINCVADDPLVNKIIRWFDITDTTVAILSWWAGFFICFVVLLFIYFVVERYYRHLEYHYNEALAKYKESSGKTK